jgi:DNA-binding protein YbaB
VKEVDMGPSTEEYDSIMREAADRLERVREMGAQMAELRGEGEAADGKVRVLVQQGGRLETLELDPRAMRMASEDLAAAIVEAVAAATEDATAKASELMESVLPGAGASIVGMTDPDSLADAKATSEEAVNSIIDSLRRGF